ncbi:MAG: hypothetical protein ACETV1_06100 [Candidatus Bathyarchaeia archaeon]
MKEKSSSKGYILRISRDEWVRQVFSLKRYYAGVRRRWEPELTIFFARKAEKGDSFLGCGVIKSVQKAKELSGRERAECEKWGWRHVLHFKNLVKFEPPLPIKETAIKDVGVYGRLLHGYSLTQAQIQSLLSKAQQLCDRVAVNC